MEAVIFGEAAPAVQSALRVLTGQTVVGGPNGLAFWVGDLAPPARESLAESGIISPGPGQLATVGPNAAWISDSTYQVWKAGLASPLARYLDILRRRLEAIESWLRDFRPCAWLRWVAVAGWLIDIEVNRVLRGKGWFGETTSKLLVWFLETEDHAFPNFGVRTQSGGTSSAFFCEMWLDGLKKIPSLPVNLGEAEILALGGVVTGQASSSLALARSRYFGLVRTGTDTLELTIPHLGPSDWGTFRNIVTGAATEIAARALLADGYRPLLPDRDRKEIYCHAFARLLMRAVLSQLLRDRVLEIPAHPVPAAWGTWLAIGGEARYHFQPPLKGDNHDPD